MARKPRIEYEGALYDDYLKYLEVLAHDKEQYGFYLFT
jgi:hypothetical protein